MSAGRDEREVAPAAFDVSPRLIATVAHASNDRRLLDDDEEALLRDARASLAPIIDRVRAERDRQAAKCGTRTKEMG